MSDNMFIMPATVTKIELNKTMTKKAGGTFVAHVLTYETMKNKKELSTYVFPNDAYATAVAALSVGDKIVVKKDMSQGQFGKVVAIEDFVGKSATGSSKSFTSSDNYNDRAAKGQALNLAVQTAISLGKSDDDILILSLVERYYHLSEKVQSTDFPSSNPLDDIASAITEGVNVDF